MSRRGAVAILAGSVLAPRLAFAQDDDAEINEVRRIAQEAGLKPFQVYKLDRYRAIGDAARPFLTRATELCRDLSRDFIREFKDKKFSVEKTKGLMTLVVLSSRQAFNQYLGVDLGPEIAGVYEPETNRLILFDNRAGGDNPNAGKTNTVVLFHEATHQLTFSTGLLEREGDIPLAIAEGFANYGEVRTVKGRPSVGSVNRERLVGLFPRPGQRIAELNPVSDLITQDDLLEADATKQRAYSECWLLVHYLMKTKERVPELRQYLEAIRGRRDNSRRLEDWTAAFGPTEKMDGQLRAHALRLL